MSHCSADRDRRRFMVRAIALAVVQVCPSVVMADPAADAGTEDEWRSVLMTMFPHPGVDAGLYEPAAAALIAAAADPNVRSLLAAGRRMLAAAAGGDWSAADALARSKAVAASVGTPLFVLLRQTTVFTFYNDPRVWSLFGYEAGSGGWLQRGVDTIDWLPTPPKAQRP
jgi:hypothetical protein